MAQGTATPLWQGAFPNRAELHNCSGVGQCPCRQTSPPHAALGGCRASEARRLSACCLATTSAAISTAVRSCAAWASQHLACTTQLFVLPAPCLCCLHLAWPALAALLQPTHTTLLSIFCLWHYLPCLAWCLPSRRLTESSPRVTFSRCLPLLLLLHTQSQDASFHAPHHGLLLWTNPSWAYGLVAHTSAHLISHPQPLCSLPCAFLHSFTGLRQSFR